MQQSTAGHGLGGGDESTFCSNRNWPAEGDSLCHVPRQAAGLGRNHTWLPFSKGQWEVEQGIWGQVGISCPGRPVPPATLQTVPLWWLHWAGRTLQELDISTGAHGVWGQGGDLGEEGAECPPGVCTLRSSQAGLRTLGWQARPRGVVTGWARGSAGP